MTPFRVTRAQFLSRLLCAAVLPAAVMMGSGTSRAAGDDTFQVEVQVIEAWRGAKGAPAPLDPALAPLQQDLKDLPFQNFRLVDGMKKVLAPTEVFNLQFGKPEARRFLRVTARGKQAGKVRLDVAMENNASGKLQDEFRSGVSIAEGGTLVVVAARQPVQDNVILLAITAQRPRN